MEGRQKAKKKKAEIDEANRIAEAEAADTLTATLQNGKTNLNPTSLGPAFLPRSKSAPKSTTDKSLRVDHSSIPEAEKNGAGLKIYKLAGRGMRTVALPLPPMESRKQVAGAQVAKQLGDGDGSSPSLAMALSTAITKGGKGGKGGKGDLGGTGGRWQGSKVNGQLASTVEETGGNMPATRKGVTGVEGGEEGGDNKIKKVATRKVPFIKKSAEGGFADGRPKVVSSDPKGKVQVVRKHVPPMRKPSERQEAGRRKAAQEGGAGDGEMECITTSRSEKKRRNTKGGGCEGDCRGGGRQSMHGMHGNDTLCVLAVLAILPLCHLASLSPFHTNCQSVAPPHLLSFCHLVFLPFSKRDATFPSLYKAALCSLSVFQIPSLISLPPSPRNWIWNRHVASP